MAKIARMYHQRGMRQAEIAAELHVSQPRVSRLLKRAAEAGIVRTTIAGAAPGCTPTSRRRWRHAYGLGEAVVVDVGGSDAEIVPALGSATALYLETTLTGGDTVGIASWSATLLAAVEQCGRRGPVVDTVVQLVGGVGEPRVQMQATRLLGQFAAAPGRRRCSCRRPACSAAPRRAPR